MDLEAGYKKWKQTNPKVKSIQSANSNANEWNTNHRIYELKKRLIEVEAELKKIDVEAELKKISAEAEHKILLLRMEYLRNL